MRGHDHERDTVCLNVLLERGNHRTEEKRCRHRQAGLACGAGTHLLERRLHALRELHVEPGVDHRCAAAEDHWLVNVHELHCRTGVAGHSQGERNRPLTERRAIERNEDQTEHVHLRRRCGLRATSHEACSARAKLSAPAESRMSVE